MRKHFYDLLTDAVIDPRAELRQLCALFSKEKLYPSGSFTAISLERFIDREFFRKLSFRGSYIDVESMRKALELTEIDFDDPFVDLDTLFLFSEFLLAFGAEGEPFFRGEAEFRAQMAVIRENIAHFLEKTNHCLHNISETHVSPRIGEKKKP